MKYLSNDVESKVNHHRQDAGHDAWEGTIPEIPDGIIIR